MEVAGINGLRFSYQLIVQCDTIKLTVNFIARCKVDLVESKKDGIFCDSSMVARKFGIKHNDVTRSIKKIIPNLEDFRGAGCTPKIEVEERTYRGKDYTAYLLSKDAFVIVMMRFDTKRARQWQGRFIGAFNGMEKMLLQETLNKQSDKWITDRQHGKQIRLETTDIIKDFVDYATDQGSKSARHYYKHITNATYKALGLLTQKKPKLRDTLDLYELSQLATAEQVVQRSFKVHMADKIPYKAIYKLVVADLDRFSKSLLLQSKTL